MRGVLCRALNVALLAAAIVSWGDDAATADAPIEAARRVDSLLHQELFASLPADGPQLAPVASDQIFLRRVHFDFVGAPPSPEDVIAFSLDPAVDKRSRTVERLLADSRFGGNWARYFRDVIYYRRAQDRALVGAAATETYLADRLNANAPWDAIARDFITAAGSVQQNGAAGIIMAQMGMAEEIAAEVSRVFLGVQIQCAQCHDHPTDRWKRYEFHQLAAFFPRVRLRPGGAGERFNFEIVAQDRNRPFARNNPDNPRFGDIEHKVENLKDPTTGKAEFTPALFVTGQNQSVGSTDSARRASLAEWLTAPKNPWFAKALVNRLWAELVGEGFYEPIDDIGPDRQCSAPAALDYLAEQFVANGYDVKWLLRTIAGTQAYGRESRSRRHADQTPFLANCVQRLRSDQAADALAQALGADLFARIAQGPRQDGKGAAGPGQFLNGPRARFAQIFGFDPSEPRGELSGSIPQALYLMNSQLINRGIDSPRRRNWLHDLLAQSSDDRRVIDEIYLRCLSREPSEAEWKACAAFLADAVDRNAACEDVVWALVNGAEFLHRP